MDKIAKLPMQERQELIIATASKMKISEGIVEKDFWVCFCRQRNIKRDKA